MFLAPAAALADGFGFGWQYTGPASGFSLRLPLDRNLAIQPLLSLSMQDRADGAAGHAIYGLRALVNLPALGPVHPYLGAGIGRSSRFGNGQTEIAQGGQAFLGLEYQGSSLRPSFEVGVGYLNRPDGVSYLGTMLNFGLHYYFDLGGANAASAKPDPSPL